MFHLLGHFYHTKNSFHLLNIFGEHYCSFLCFLQFAECLDKINIVLEL